MSEQTTGAPPGVLERFSLAGRVGIVTGALGLIGRRHVEALAAAGAHVVVVDLDARACVALAGELAERHGRAMLAGSADITDRASLEAVLAAVRERWDRLDVLVNNAAINDAVEAPPGADGGALPEGVRAQLSRFENYPLDLWRRCLDVNVTGTFLCCQVFGAEMARRASGSVINVASTYGIVAPDQSLYRKPDGTQDFYKSAVYPASKGAVLMLTRFLAAYWGEVGVRVNALSPGGVQNGQPQHFVERYARRTPLGRMAQADDYEGALVFLASDASSYMTGANLVVDGGWTTW